MIEKTEAAPLLRPVITEKGLAAANQAATLGKPAVISHVAVSATPGEAKPTDETLPGAGEKMPIDDGRVVVDGQVNISMLLRDTYPTTDICGLAFYLADGTMFAAYRTTEPFLYHKQGETLLVGMDFVMGNIPSDSIIVESTGANLVFGDWVPDSRRVNGKRLDRDITLTLQDLGYTPPDLSGYVPSTRRINGKNLAADVMLNAIDVNAAPSGFGLGEEQAYTVTDLNTDPMTWNGGKNGWVRGISSTLNKPLNVIGTAIFQRYQRGDTSAGNLLYFAGERLFTRRWSGSAWANWVELYSTAKKPTPADIGAVTEQQVIELLKGAGGDRIGSVTPMMAVQDHLVIDGDKVYLKEGVTLEDAENLFPEAFEQLSGAGGKQFLISTSGSTGTGSIKGFAASNGKALIAYDTSSETIIASVDPVTRKRLAAVKIPIRVKSNFVEYAGKWIASTDNNKFLAVDIADPASYQQVDSTMGSWGTSIMTSGRATAGGILWITGSKGELVFMAVTDQGVISTMTKLTFAEASDTFRCVLSFADKAGNRVNFAVTSSGEVFWKAGDNPGVMAGWVKKWPQVGGDAGVPTTRAVYSVAADVVYFAGDYGEYVVCDPRMSPLNSDGAVAIRGVFQGEYEAGLSFCQIGDTIFASPVPHNQDDSLNTFFRLDPVTASWDTFKHGVNVVLIGDPVSVGGVEVGGHMVGAGRLGKAGSSSFTVMISSPAVHLQTDPTTKGGIANYVRIK